MCALAEPATFWNRPWLCHSGSPSACGNCRRIGIHDNQCLNRSEHRLPPGTDLEMISDLPELAKLAIRQCQLHSRARLNTLVSESSCGQSWIHFDGIDGFKHTVNTTCLNTDCASMQELSEPEPKRPKTDTTGEGLTGSLGSTCTNHDKNIPNAKIKKFDCSFCGTLAYKDNLLLVCPTRADWSGCLFTMCFDCGQCTKSRYHWTSKALAPKHMCGLGSTEHPGITLRRKCSNMFPDACKWDNVPDDELVLQLDHISATGLDCECDVQRITFASYQQTGCHRPLSGKHCLHVTRNFLHRTGPTWTQGEGNRHSRDKIMPFAELTQKEKNMLCEMLPAANYEIHKKADTNQWSERCRTTWRAYAMSCQAKWDKH